MQPKLLHEAIREDVAGGRRPFLVVANAGSTNTGAVDPLGDLADICAAHGMWLHVDAAYGGFFTLTDRGREARSPGSSAATRSRSTRTKASRSRGGRAGALDALADAERRVRMYPGYLGDARQFDDAVNLFDRGLQLTRPARAVKIWLSVETLGLAPFREALDAAIDSALVAQATVEAHPDAELVTPACLGIVTFRRRDGRDTKKPHGSSTSARPGTCRRPSSTAASHSGSASTASGRRGPTWRPCWRSCSARSPATGPSQQRPAPPLFAEPGT